MFNFKASPLVLEYTYGSSGMIEFYATPPVIYKPQPNEQSLPNIEKTEVSVNGQLNRSVMQSIKTEARGKHDLQGEWLEYKRTLATTEHKALIKHGIFRVVEQEYSVDEDKTSFTMYDLMVRTHKEVHKDEFTLEFPTTLLGLFKEVARICELETDVTSFRNSDVVVSRDEWTNTENTYRDILDHIAGIVGMTIGIRDNKLDIWQPQETGITLNENRAKDLRVGEKVGKFNILNITQEPQHYNTPYPPNWKDIPVDDRVEYVLENNPIVEQDRGKFAPIVFNNIKDLEYYEFETDTYGWGIFDIGDIVTVKDLDGNEYKSIVTGEYGEFNGAFTSKVVSERLDNAKDEYVVASDQRREGQRVYLIVDQQEGKIQGLIEKTDDQEDRITSITLDLEGIKTEVSSLNTEASIIPNLNGTMENYYGWEWENSNLYNHPRLVQRENLRANTNFLITEIPNSLSRFGLEFYSNGSAITSKGYVVPDTTYSFRSKRVKGSQDYTVEVMEYKDDELNKSTRFELEGTQAYGAFTMTPHVDTNGIRLKFIISDVSHDNPLILTEMMFNRGNPSEYREGASDVKIWAQSQFTQVDNGFALTAQEIDALNKDIHNAGVEINAKDGITTYGKKFSVMNSDKSKELLGVVTVDGEEQLIIDISNGSVGNFSLKEGVMEFTTPEFMRPYNNADLTYVWTMVTRGFPTTSNDLLAYDLNNDGKIDMVDVIRVDKHVKGIEMIEKVVKVHIEIGTKQGEIKTTMLYQDGEDWREGEVTIIDGNGIQARNVTTNAISTNALSINGVIVGVGDDGVVKEL